MQKNNFIFLKFICLICLISTICLAESLEKLAKQAKEAGQAAASKGEPQINNNFTDINNHALKDTIGFSGTDIQGSNMKLTDAEDLGSTKLLGNTDSKCTKDDCSVGDTFGTNAMKKRQEEVEKIGFTKDENGMPVNNQGYLDKALKRVKNSDKEFDYLSGGYAGCEPGEETITTHNENTCDQYYSSKVSDCFPKQIVEIDPEYSYVCHKKRDAKTKICRDVIAKITCKKSKECDMGGIEQGSVASDMKFEHSGGVLTIGTIADNYWGGQCATYDRSTSFKIKHLSEVKEFSIFKVGFDDYMQISINDHVVYVGPDGGKFVEVQNRERSNGWGWKRTFQIVHNGDSDNKCERDTNWNRDVNIDLKPYLKEGENILKTRVIVSGNGEGWLQIKAKQNCCSEWDIKREEKCDFS